MLQDNDKQLERIRIVQRRKLDGNARNGEVEKTTAVSISDQPQATTGQQDIGQIAEH